MTTNTSPGAKVKWESGGAMLTPAGTIEVHTDEGDVVGYVYPQFLDAVLSHPEQDALVRDLTEALENLMADHCDRESRLNGCNINSHINARAVLARTGGE